jgi:hypothetical protein
MRAPLMLAATLAVGLAAVTARADEPVLHDKIFYMQHAALREATLGWCHADARRSHMADCQNAEAAGNAKLFTRPMTDPLANAEFWRENPAARDGILRICAHPTEADGPYLPYCKYAAAGVGR